MSDFNIRISYRNKNMSVVNERVYDIIDYTQMIKNHLTHVIMDIENAFFDMNGGKNREEWTEESREAFKNIRHKILDDANSVQRIPNNLFYKNVPCINVSVSDWIAQMINAMTAKEETKEQVKAITD